MLPSVPSQTAASPLPSLRRRRSHQVRGWLEMGKIPPEPPSASSPSRSRDHPAQQPRSERTGRNWRDRQTALSSRGGGAALLLWKPAEPEPSGVGASGLKNSHLLTRPWRKGHTKTARSHQKPDQPEARSSTSGLRNLKNGNPCCFSHPARGSLYGGGPRTAMQMDETERWLEERGKHWNEVRGLQLRRLYGH